MKKILIPTDFSVQSENASKYAVAFASLFHAELVIANAYQLPEEESMFSRVLWSLMDLQTIKQQSTYDLGLLVNKLKILNKLKYSSVDLPIEIRSCSGSVLEVTTQLVHEKDIDLVIMGMAGAGFLPQVIFGSNCRIMIDRATFPVMYIPADMKYQPIENIAFATDLDAKDIDVIKNMIDLFGRPHIQIRLIHIIEKEFYPESKVDIKVKDFIKEVQNNITNANIVFDAVTNIDVEDDLESLIAELNIDVLVMIHRLDSFKSRFFYGSHTQKISRKVHIPLLVFPA